MIIGKDHKGNEIGYCDSNVSCLNCDNKCIGEKRSHLTPNDTLIQISFAGNADLDIIREQLTTLVKESTDKYGDHVKFVHLFLPRHIVLEKGFNTSVVDLLDEILGDNQYNPIADSSDFNEYMSKIEEARIQVAAETDSLAVLGVEVAEGVIKEIYARTSSLIFVKQQDKKVI